MSGEIQVIDERALADERPLRGRDPAQLAAINAVLDSPISDPLRPVSARTPREVAAWCEILLASGLYVVQLGRGESRPVTAREALVISLTGARLGLDVVASLEAIRIVEGRPAMMTRAQLAVVRARGLIADLARIDSTNESATWRGLRVGDSTPTEVTYTWADAQAAGLGDRKNWQRYRSDMLSWRALSRLLGLLFPDVLMGVSSLEEMQDAAGNDDVVIIRPSVETTAPPAERPAAVPSPVERGEAPRFAPLPNRPEPGAPGTTSASFTRPEADAPRGAPRGVARGPR